MSGALASNFDRDLKPLLTKYCVECHSGDETNGGVDFADFGNTAKEIGSDYEIWESVAEHLENRTMPPDDSPQPTDDERSRALQWYGQFVSSVKARPDVLRPRRLSKVEYRNTLRSLLGFDLETAVIEAEQTDSETSLVLKLLPIDPPGASGFTNDTHANPLSAVAWDQYAYFTDVGLEELFSESRRQQLEKFTGSLDQDAKIDLEQAKRMIRRFAAAARRRPLPAERLRAIVSRLPDQSDALLAESLKLELKALLMSPEFLYRGFLADGKRGVPQPVDDFEFAERLSYFLWADMPDQELMTLAERGILTNAATLKAQFDRMLKSPKARSLAEVFVSEWLTLSEIDLASDNPPIRDALKSQPVDFMHYLFTDDRPLIEMVKSNVTFANAHTARFYGRDAKQIVKPKRRVGIESENYGNQQIRIENASERGGVLTMPGILAMNRGPILRGTWILERVLGEHLPDPPANVGQVAANVPGEHLTFRERFEKHRSQPACAVCHDKIDPLGFSLQTFDKSGQYVLAKNYNPKRKGKTKEETEAPERLDTSGILPSGTRFANINELKEILASNKRDEVIRNLVRRTMAYALCRKLEVFDLPTVDTITIQMIETNGTWRDLFFAIVTSLPFREAILSEQFEP